MDEVRRFIRFTIPGIAFLIQLCVVLFLTNDKWLLKVTSGEVFRDGFFSIITGMFAGSILISIGIGYILAQLYWGLYWWSSFPLFTQIDHLMAITKLKSKYKDKFNISSASGLPVELNTMNKKDGWNIVTDYFDRNFKKTEIEGYQVMCSRLIDVTHSLGAVIAGNLILLGWIYYNLCINICLIFECNFTCYFQILNYFLAFLLIIITTSIMYVAYKSSANSHQSLANSTFVSLINEDIRRSSSNSITLYYER